MKHEFFETHLGWLILLILLVVGLGGVTEFLGLRARPPGQAPIAGIRPYTPLELRGRDLYIREGCYGCHSQMVRPLPQERLRYGAFSLAEESRYDHPFQWGSRRTGPDLARIGGKYPDDWHVRHLSNPRILVPDSLMPAYPWLTDNTLRFADIEKRMRALKRLGLPYSLTDREYRANLNEYGPWLANQFDIHYAKRNLIAEAASKDGDGNPGRITEMDALVAYLQVLGTMPDFDRLNQGWIDHFR